MTTREFYELVINDATTSAELKEFATAAITKLDHTNELRKVAAAKKAATKDAERAPIREALVNVITNEPKTATTLIAEAGVEVKPQAVPSLLKGFIEDGVIAKTEIKVTGKGKQVGYVRG